MTGDGSFASIKPTLKLSNATRAAIENGTLRLRRGQWVEDEFGTYGRFLGLRNDIAFVSWVHDEESPAAFDRRFLWSLRKHSKVAYFRYQLTRKLPSYLYVAIMVLWFVSLCATYVLHSR
jgi:hypothetical protein